MYSTACETCSPNASSETSQLTSARAINLPPREKYPLLCRRRHVAVVSQPSKMTSRWGKSADVCRCGCVFCLHIFSFRILTMAPFMILARFGNSFHPVCWVGAPGISGASVGTQWKIMKTKKKAVLWSHLRIAWLGFCSRFTFKPTWYRTFPGLLCQFSTLV